MVLWLPLALLLLFVAGCAPAEEEPVSVQPSGPAEVDTSESMLIGLSAERAEGKPSVLSTGQSLSCVRVTVTNSTEKPLEVNPLYFSVTDTEGVRYEGTSALGMYENEIDTTVLAPGEKAEGMFCAEGDFRPTTIAMTSPLLIEIARAEVA
ncbi:DUF4352 domain-containing protein [Actinomadura sp. GC306]|uniref:DUF4352 domain-containing protein n=1 Tax=Actinomadura sp. GC306 TaxID=2530367 RepID=UPI001404DF55|nr:DUF4352 domain-containing protein [Actinomadura sp. GC306]